MITAGEGVGERVLRGPSNFITRGECTPDQIAAMDEILIGHGEPASSPHEVHPLLAFVCLGCGSITVAQDQGQRDAWVKSYVDGERGDPACCGVTVYFHSTHAVLVNPENLDWSKVKVTVVRDDDEPLVVSQNALDWAAAEDAKAEDEACDGCDLDPWAPPVHYGSCPLAPQEVDE